MNAKALSIFKRLRGTGKAHEGQFTIDRARQEELGIHLEKGGVIESTNVTDKKVKKKERRQNLIRQIVHICEKLKEQKIPFEEAVKLVPKYIFASRNEEHFVVNFENREKMWGGKSDIGIYPRDYSVNSAPLRHITNEELERFIDPKSEHLRSEGSIDLMVLTRKESFFEARVRYRWQWDGEKIAVISKQYVSTRNYSSGGAFFRLNESYGVDLDEECQENDTFEKILDRELS